MDAFNNDVGFPGGTSGKESSCQCRRHGFDPWVGKIPWRRAWQPTPVFLPRESRGQRSLVGCTPQGHKEMGTAEQRTHGMWNVSSRTRGRSLVPCLGSTVSTPEQPGNSQTAVFMTLSVELNLTLCQSCLARWQRHSTTGSFCLSFSYFSQPQVGLDSLI